MFGHDRLVDAGAPDRARLEEFAVLAQHYGIAIDVDVARTPKGLKQVLERLKGHPAEKPLSFQLLRSLKQATYDVVNLGHFGLASTDYLHFTSPIRRYPDLVVHRLLKSRLARDGKPAGGFKSPVVSPVSVVGSPLLLDVVVGSTGSVVPVVDEVVGASVVGSTVVEVRVVVVVLLPSLLLSPVRVAVSCGGSSEKQAALVRARSSRRRGIGQSHSTALPAAHRARRGLRDAGSLRPARRARDRRQTPLRQRS